MNTNLKMVMCDLLLGNVNWTLESQQKLNLMLEIADIVEEQKSRHKHTTSIETQSFGRHFKECVWADPDVTEGPDTCVCCTVGRNEHMFIQLLESIGPEECGEELYNTLLNEIVGEV